MAGNFNQQGRVEITSAAGDVPQPPAAPPMALPRPKMLQAALRMTTETLAHELARPTDVAPAWSDLQWRIAFAVAAMHGVSPLLSGVLRWEGPAGWREFLQEQKAHTLARHANIQDLLRAIDDRACAAGIPVVALKGAELHARGLYAPGERPMADVDLLVRNADMEPASRLLESLGFHEAYSNWKHKVFFPPRHAMPVGLGEHAGNYLKIELHRQIREALPVDTVDMTDWVFPAQAHPGLNPYPSQAALMGHLLLHAAGSMAYRALRLLHLHDLALLSARMTDADWDEFLAHSASANGHWWALPPLRLAARYYRAAIPTRAVTELAATCPWLLSRIVRDRTLSDVSLSHLWIDAFPGIEWSQSVSEMLRYAASRLRPSRKTLALRRQMVQTEVAASQSEWHHLSQGRRALRWIVSRPARAETMHTVRAALAAGPVSKPAAAAEA